MKKIFVFGIILLMLLTLILSACKTTTKQDVLDMLNKCKIYGARPGTSCDQACASAEKTCISASVVKELLPPDRIVTGTYLECSEDSGIDEELAQPNVEKQCLCCSP